MLKRLTGGPQLKVLKDKTKESHLGIQNMMEDHSGKMHFRFVFLIFLMKLWFLLIFIFIVQLKWIFSNELCTMIYDYNLQTPLNYSETWCHSAILLYHMHCRCCCYIRALAQVLHHNHIHDYFGQYSS